LTQNRIGILHYASPPIIGGVETTIYHHSRQFSEAGLVVDVISGRGERFIPQINFHLIPEVSSRFPELRRINNALANGEITPEFYSLRDHLVNKLHPVFSNLDVCIIHNVLTLHKNLPLTAALHHLSEAKVTPYVAWCHDFAWLDDLYTTDLHPGYPWDLLKSAWHGVKYVTVSNYRRKRLTRLAGLSLGEINVINPGIDVSEFLKLEPITRNLIDRLKLLKAKPLLLLPARITQRKNIEFGIRVIGALTRQFPKAVLIITGPPGPHNPKNIAYLESLNSLVMDMGLSENVYFLYQYGESDQPLYLPDQVVADFYRLADLLFFPSFREGFGIPVLEAGLMHLPIFAADIPPIRESAGDAAYLFDPTGDPLPVANAIASHLKMDKRYHLKQRVLGKFSWESIINKQVIPLMNEVIIGGQKT
jgi:mannosylglucosylglycerate synthase